MMKVVLVKTITCSVFNYCYARSDLHEVSSEFLITDIVLSLH